MIWYKHYTWEIQQHEIMHFSYQKNSNEYKNQCFKHMYISTIFNTFVSHIQNHHLILSFVQILYPGGLFDVREHIAGETGGLETAFRSFWQFFSESRFYFISLIFGQIFEDDYAGCQWDFLHLNWPNTQILIFFHEPCFKLWI